VIDHPDGIYQFKKPVVRPWHGAYRLKSERSGYQEGLIFGGEWLDGGYREYSAAHESKKMHPLRWRLRSTGFKEAKMIVDNEIPRRRRGHNGSREFPSRKDQKLG